MPDIMEHCVWNAVIAPYPYSFVIVRTLHLAVRRVTCIQ